MKLNQSSKEIIQDKIDSGQFNSPEEVIDASLRLLIINENYDIDIGPKLFNELLDASNSLNRGEGIVYDHDSLMDVPDQIIQNGRKRINLVAS